MDFTEKKISRKDVFHGRILDVHVDTVELPNGKQATREVVDHPGGVGILAIDERDNVVLVSQYRYVFGKTILEIPAGKLEPGEDPAVAALRELKEETGASPVEFIPMGRLLASPGCYGEVLWLFLARGLTQGQSDPDEDEFLSVERIPFDELIHRISTGEIEDAKTVAAALKAKTLLAR